MFPTLLCFYFSLSLAPVFIPVTNITCVRFGQKYYNNIITCLNTFQPFYYLSRSSSYKTNLPNRYCRWVKQIQALLLWQKSPTIKAVYVLICRWIIDPSKKRNTAFEVLESTRPLVYLVISKVFLKNCCQITLNQTTRSWHISNIF